jgi:hypothetical protein
VPTDVAVETSSGGCRSVGVFFAKDGLQETGAGGAIRTMDALALRCAAYRVRVRVRAEGEERNRKKNFYSLYAARASAREMSRAFILTP